MTEPQQEQTSTAFAARKDVLAALASAANRSVAGTGGGTKFHKLDAQSQAVRVAQDPTDLDNPWIVGIRQHKGLNAEGKFRTALDLGWLLANGKRYPGLLDDLSIEDRELITANGDPAAVLASLVRDVVKGKLDQLPADLQNARHKPFSEFRGVVTAIKDQTPGILEVNKAGYDTLIQMSGSDPGVFTVTEGYNLQFTTNGKSGMAKRYNPPTLILSSKGPAEYEGEFPKVVQVLKARIIPYAEKVEFVARNYEAFIRFVEDNPGA